MLIQRSLQFWPFQKSLQKVGTEQKVRRLRTGEKSEWGRRPRAFGRGFDAVVLEFLAWSRRVVVYASGTSRTELSPCGGAVAGRFDVAVRARPPLVHALAGGRPICSLIAALRAASHIANDSQLPKANRVLAAAHVEPARSGIRDRPGSARRIRGLQHARETACECRVTCTVL